MIGDVMHAIYRQASQTDPANINLTERGSGLQKMMKTLRVLNPLNNSILRNVSPICEGNINTFQQYLEI